MFLIMIMYPFRILLGCRIFLLWASLIQMHSKYFLSLPSQTLNCALWGDRVSLARAEESWLAHLGPWVLDIVSLERDKFYNSPLVFIELLKPTTVPTTRDKNFAIGSLSQKNFSTQTQLTAYSRLSHGHNTLRRWEIWIERQLRITV